MAAGVHTPAHERSSAHVASDDELWHVVTVLPVVATPRIKVNIRDTSSVRVLDSWINSISDTDFMTDQKISIKH